MARSIRSKRGRKMRAMKREKYAKKELAKLKETVKDLGVAAVANPDHTVFCRPVDQPLGAEGQTGLALEPMDTRNVPLTRKYDPKTLKDEHGRYPPWMNQRKIKKHRAQLAKKRQKTKGGGGKAKQSRKKKGKAKSAW